MPKVGMEPLRTRQTIDATMACIHEDGMANASLQRIATRAGITPGLILHYFGDKQGLYEAVYRDLYKRLGDESAKRVKNAGTPAQHLFAVLEAQVCDSMIEPQIVATWFAIGAKAPETPSLARMERINSGRLVSNLTHILRGVGLQRNDAKDVAEELLALIYGLWVNLAHTTISKPEQAREVLHRYITARVPGLSNAKAGSSMRAKSKPRRGK